MKMRVIGRAAAVAGLKGNVLRKGVVPRKGSVLRVRCPAADRRQSR